MNTSETSVAPAQADALRQLLDQQPILARLAGRVDHRPADLHLAVGIGEGAPLLGVGGGRQHHVGVPGGLGEEDVLHHQVLQVGQRLAGVLHVGVGHGRVLAQDVHALDHVVLDGVHDLDHGEALGRQLNAPERLVPAADLGVLHRLVVGEHHGDQAGVGGALHVVLAAQGMQAGAGSSDLAGGQGERDQAAGVVGAVRVLGDAHAPEDDGALGAGVEPRHLADGGRGDAAHGLHGLGGEVGHLVLKGVEAFGVGLHVLDVDHALRDDDIEHGVEQRHVAAGLELAGRGWHSARAPASVRAGP